MLAHLKRAYAIYAALPWTGPYCNYHNDCYKEQIQFINLQSHANFSMQFFPTLISRLQIKANRFANLPLRCIVNKNQDTCIQNIGNCKKTKCVQPEQIFSKLVAVAVDWSLYTCYYREFQTVASPNLLILFWIEKLFEMEVTYYLKAQHKANIYSKLVVVESAKCNSIRGLSGSFKLLHLENLCFLFWTENLLRLVFTHNFSDYWTTQKG